MDLLINIYQFGDRPEVNRPDLEFYNVMGENGMRKMVNDHYELLKQSSIKHLFPADDNAFEMAKKHSADFMIQICGGPNYFNQNRGKPLLANRHAPFAITPEARLVWLNCYKEVLMKLDIPENLILSFWNYVNIFSNWMVNTKPAE
jgi:hemoglobin